MPRQRLFVDDSGNREYASDRNYETGKSRHFVYGGLLIEERESFLLVARLRELKQLTFGTADVEIKSNWLRIPHESQTRYINRFGVTADKLTRFVDDYITLVLQAPLQLFGIVVDKLHMQEKYPAPWMAPTVAYEFLMQRVVQAIQGADTLVVTIDQISGSSASKKAYEDLLRSHHDRLRHSGSSLLKSLSFKCVEGGVKFKDSARSDLLQVSDLVAYNLLRQFRDHGLLWEQMPLPGGTLEMYPHFRRIAGKFRQGPEGRIQGYGIVKCPIVNRVPWKLKRKE